MKASKGEKWFAVVNYVILSLIACATLYPFVYVFSASISSGQSVVSGDVVLFPKQITLEAYYEVLKQDGIWLAYGNTIYYTVVGTAISIVLTVLGAYPLSKRRLLGRTQIGMFIAFTMLFQAGMIPVYLNLKDLGLVNTRLSLLIAFAISTWNFIVLRSFFQSVPEEMEEAAKIDGASDNQVLWKIYMPLSLPALAAISLFYAVGRWNAYFWAMVLIRDEDKLPLQVILQKLIVNMKPPEETQSVEDFVSLAAYSTETIVYATIVVAILPVIVVYPFIQKYFVKGVMVGSLKG